jgi:DNA topoisomerase VI subunit B
VIFVHMASVWVPFTSESKEAIADYDEIRKEITLALRECGRRLGVFIRRRGRAESEFRRRNIFELYIEEVVDACNRLKGGKLPAEKIKQQLQKIATSKTGGLKTDELLGKTGAGPEGLPDSIIVTPEGVEGAVAVVEPAEAEAAPAEAVKKKGKTSSKAKTAEAEKKKPKAKTKARAQTELELGEAEAPAEDESPAEAPAAGATAAKAKKPRPARAPKAAKKAGRKKESS